MVSYLTPTAHSEVATSRRTPPSAYGLLQEAKWFESVLATADIALRTNSTHALLAAARAGAGPRSAAGPNGLG